MPKNRRVESISSLAVVFSREQLYPQRHSWMLKVVGGRGRLSQSEWRPLQQARRRYVSAWLAMAESRATLARSAQLSSGSSGSPGDNVLKILAEELLDKEELAEFKRTLQHFRVSRSVPTLCSRLKSVVTSTDKLILLLELSCRMPRSLQRDFHKLCTLTFHNYEPFLRYFNPNYLTPGPEAGSKVIAQDSSGQFQVVSTGFEKSLQVGKAGETNGTDLQSLPGTSATSGIYSETDDVARIDDTLDGVTNDVRDSVKNDDTSLSQTPPRASRRDSAPPRSGGILRQNSSDVDKVEAQKPPRPPTLIRAHRKYSTLGRHTSPHEEAAEIMAEPGRKRVLLKRREDGSLGIGIKGGKEYGSPIVVFVVEPRSEAEKQGLRVDDEIVDVNGTDFSNMTHAEAVTLMRNAWNLILNVKAGQGATAEPANVRSENGEWDAVVYPSADGKMGCGVVRGSNGRLLISEVDHSSPAHKAGILTGDSILKIDGVEVGSLSDLQISTMTKAKRVLLHLQSRGKTSRQKSQTGTVASSDDVFSLSDVDTDDSPTSLHDVSKANHLKATTQQVKGQSAPRSSSASRTVSGQRLYQPRSHSPGQLHSAAYYMSQQARRAHSGSRQKPPSHGDKRGGVMVYHTRESKQAASKERRSRSSSRGLRLRVFQDRSPSPVFTGRKITVPIVGTDREVLHAVQKAIDMRQRARRKSVVQTEPVGEEWRI